MTRARKPNLPEINYAREASSPMGPHGEPSLPSGAVETVAVVQDIGPQYVPFVEETPLMPSMFYLLKELHPDIGISRLGILRLNEIVVKAFDRITDEAVRLVQVCKGSTVKEEDLETAVKFVLPENMAKKAIENAEKKLQLLKKVDEEYGDRPSI